MRHGLTRRRLLGAGFGLATLGTLGGAAYLVSDRPVARGRRALSEREERVVAALADAHFPPGKLSVSARDVDVVAGADAYLASLLPKDRRLFRALLTALDQWPRASLASSRAFSALDTAARVEVLRAFESSPLQERRLIASLLRALIAMPFFEDPRVLAAIGHAPGCAL